MEVPNDYGYYTLDVRRGRVPLDENVPRKVRLRLRVEDTSVAELNRVTSDIRQFYNVQELRYDRQNSGTASPMESDESDVNIGDIRSVSYQSKLIEKYLDRERDLDEDMIGRVKKLNKDINNKIENEDLKRNVQWRLKRFEWDNVFSYGEGNEIEFENMEGIVGLFAENASGKSSLLDAVTFCLFDKCSRAYKSTDILNNQSEWFRCKATFELDGTEYVIERTAEFESDGRLPVDVDFYKKVAGEKVSLNGERRSKTNQKIRKYIGEYEDFISTAFSMQGSEEPMFVEKSNARRKDMLNRFIGIDVFDRLHSKAKDEIRDVEAMMNTYENRDLTTEYADAEDRLSEAKSRFSKLKNKKSDLESRRSDLKDELLDYHKELVDIPEKDLEIDSLRTQRDKLESKLESVREDRKSFEIKEREKKQPLRGFKDIIESVDEDSLEQDKNDFVELKNKLRDARNMLQNITGDIEETRSEIKHLESHEFDPDCEYCVQRNEKDADKLESLRNQLSGLEDKRERYEEIVPELEDKVDKKSQGNTPVEKWKKYQDMKSKAESTKTEIRKFKMKAQEKQVEENRVENQLKDVRSDIELYNKIQDDIEHNKSIRSDIKPVKKELESLNSKISRIEDDIQDCFSEIKVAERDKKEAKEDLEEYQRLSEETEAYNLYLEATKRDGVPYDIVEDIMPQIEQEVNEILSQIVPFGLMMHLDGKNIDAHIIYDETRYWPVELASGMEKFVSNLAIRVALTNISNMPRPNFLAIDEGFGVLDQSNLNSLSLLFDYLKTQYKFCVIISHLEVMRDMVNDHIEIESDENGKSHVSYL